MFFDSKRLRAARNLLIALALGSLAVPGCGSDNPAGPGDGDGSPGGSGPSAADLVGTWVLDEGDLAPSSDPSLQVTALRLEADGGARIWFRDDVVGGRHVTTGQWDLQDELILTVNGGVEAGAPFPALEPRAVGGATLQLVSADGGVRELTRRAVPAEIDVPALEEIERFEGLPRPDPRTDLAYEGGRLVFSSEAGIETLDPGTGTVGTPLPHAAGRIVLSHAKSPTDVDALWTTNGIDATQDVTLMSFSDVLAFPWETVSVQRLQPPASIASAAFHPGTGSLWTHGPSAGGGFRMVVVTPTAGSGPDVLDRNDAFDRPIDGMAFGPEGLWAIVRPVGQSIDVIDPTTLTVQGSFAVPDGGVRWCGLLVNDAGILLLGDDPAQESGVIVLLADPFGAPGAG